MFLITKKVKLIEKKKCATKTLNLDYKAFVVYIVNWNICFDIEIYFSKKTQIAHFKIDMASTKISN